MLHEQLCDVVAGLGELEAHWKLCHPEQYAKATVEIRLNSKDGMDVGLIDPEPSFGRHPSHNGEEELVNGLGSNFRRSRSPPTSPTLLLSFLFSRREYMSCYD